MGFVDRAKSMHARGDAVRAAVILAQGLKRDPNDAEAVGWLLHLYVEELPNPGIEADLLHVLSLQPNGADLLAIVRVELDDLGLHEKNKALDKTLDHTSLRFSSGPPPAERTASAVSEQTQPSGTDSELVQRPAPRAGSENWASFDSPFDESQGDPPPQEVAPLPAMLSPTATSSVTHTSAPELADRALSASIDLALSQPLSALDTTSSFKNDYLQDEASKSKSPSFWFVIAGVAVVCGFLIMGYLGRSPASDVEPSEWEAAPAEEASAENEDDPVEAVPSEGSPAGTAALDERDEALDGSGEALREVVDAPQDGEAE